MVNTAFGEKLPEELKGASEGNVDHDVEVGTHKQAKLSRGLQGRYVQDSCYGPHQRAD